MSPPGRLEPRAESDRLSTGSGGILCQDPNGNETGDVPDWDRQARCRGQVAADRSLRRCRIFRSHRAPTD